MGLLSRDAILSADDLKKETVAVPEWGGEVLIRTMTGAERDSFEAAVYESRGPSKQVNLKNIRARLAALVICDEKGTRLFSDSDLVALGAKSAAALDRIFAVAQRLNGMTAEDVEKLAGKSESGQS